MPDPNSSGWYPGKLWQQLFASTNANQQQPQETPTSNFGQRLTTGTAYDVNNPVTPQDIGESLQFDRNMAQGLAQRQFERQSNASSKLQDVLTGMSEESKNRIAGDKEEALRRSDATLAENLNRNNLASKNAVGQVNFSLDRVLSATDNAEAAAIGAIDRAQGSLRSRMDEFRQLPGKAEEAAKIAMDEFRNDTAQKMSAFAQAQSKNVEAIKRQRAAEMQAEGRSADEIKSEMRRVEFQGAVDTGSQFMNTYTEYNNSRATLRSNYDDKINTMRQTAASLVGQLEQTSAGLSGTAAEVHTAAGKDRAASNRWAVESINAIHQWGASADQTARLGAQDSADRIIMASTSAQLTKAQLDAAGWADWADFEGGIEEAFVPYAPVMQSILGIELMLQDRNYGYLGGGISLLQNASGAANSQAGRMQSMLSNTYQE